jgi:hypothetical protein
MSSGSAPHADILASFSDLFARGPAKVHAALSKHATIRSLLGDVVLAALREILRAASSSTSFTSTVSGDEHTRNLVGLLSSSTVRLQLCQDRRHCKTTCPNGHTLRTHHGVTWSCNKCSTHGKSVAYACRRCNFDLCRDCYLSTAGSYEVCPIATVGDVARHARTHDATMNIVGAGGTELSPGTPLLRLLAQHDAFRQHVDTLLGSRRAIAPPQSFVIHSAVAGTAGCRCGASASPESLNDTSSIWTRDSVALFTAFINNTTFNDAIAHLMATYAMRTAASASVGLVGIDMMWGSFQTVYSAFASVVPLSLRHEIWSLGAFKAYRATLESVAQVHGAVTGDVPINVSRSAENFKAHVPRADNVLVAAQTVFEKLPSLRGRVDVQFDGEAGFGEGPSQEFYTEVCSRLKARSDFWCHDGATEGGLLPTAQTRHPSEFEVLGSCMARSVVDGYLMSLPLHAAAWHALLTPSPDAAAICRVVDPSLFAAVDALRTATAADLSDMCLEFDDETAVDAANVAAFVVQRHTQTVAATLDNVSAIRRGFCKVLPIEGLRLHFLPEELTDTFCGVSSDCDEPLFDEVSLRRCLVGSHGYTSDAPEILMLIRVLTSFNRTQQTYFIEFLTGSPRLPLAGLDGLRKPITVVRRDFENSNPKTLPSCNTCFFFLKLPPYGTEERMRDCLLLAVTEGRQNFSLS